SGRPGSLSRPRNEVTPPYRRLLDGVFRDPGAADRGAARVARHVAPLSDRDLDLGPLGDVLRSPDRLHGDGVVWPFGLLWSRDVWRRGGPHHGQAAQSLACDAGGAHRRSRVRGLCRLLLDPSARHLLRDYDPDLLADILRDHLYLDRGDGG